MRIINWVFCLALLGIAVPVRANPEVSLNHVYVAKNASQTAQLGVTDGGNAATEDIEGMTFTLQIGAGTGSTPSIGSMDFLTGTIWSGHVSADNIVPAAGGADPQFKSFTLLTDNAGDFVSANGILATATFNATNAALGDYTLKMVGTKDSGSNSQFTNGLGAAVPATFGDGMLTVVVAGDFNRDNQLTSDDIPVMLAALTDLPTYQLNYSVPLGELIAIGDLTGDGSVTNADIQPLLDLVSPGTGSVQSVPEPAGWTIALPAGLALALAIVAAGTSRTRE